MSEAIAKVKFSEAMQCTGEPRVSKALTGIWIP